MTRARGIDVWQGQGDILPAHWAALRAQGISYVFVKCADDLTRDPKYSQNVERARAAGLLVGAYFVVYPYGHPQGAGDPKFRAEQAARLCDALGSMPGELPPMLDLEEPQPPNADNMQHHGVTPAQIIDWAEAWGDRARDLWDTRPLLYTYPDYYHGVGMANAPALAEYFDFFPAEYDHPGRWPLETEGPHRYEPWASAQVGRPWTFWQWAGGSGLVLPNGTKCDTSIFFADEAELAKYVASTLV